MNSDSLFQNPSPVVPVRGIHLDLKGTPPTADRLVELLNIFAAARYNAVLVEWEDSFPWTVDERYRSSTAYTPAEVGRFCEAAAELKIELIPLIQCLGHMETPLSLPDYAPLREISHDSYVLNPLAEGARPLVQKMVDDVLVLMPDVRYVHLGGDEAWSLGKNPATAEYIGEHGKGALYLQHVEPLLDSLNARNIRPILWHDMMIDWDSAALHSLAKKADLNAWGYRGHPDHSTSHFNTKHIQRLHEHGFTLWGGTAYKGADGHNVDLPNLAKRQENAVAWVEVAGRYGFAGVIATGWSRYSTHRVQCEPIDAALDSLLNVGVILHDGKPPAGGFAAIAATLGELGEKDRFLFCKEVMEKLTDVRGRGWKFVQSLREQIALGQDDTRRQGSSWEARFLRILQGILKESDTVADEVRKQFGGLMEPVWIEDYLHSRLAPLRAEFETLEPLVREIDPEGWEAAQAGALGY